MSYCYLIYWDKISNRMLRFFLAYLDSFFEAKIGVNEEARMISKNHTSFALLKILLS